MRILFLNHNGAGFADNIEIEAGTTVEALFEQQMKGARPSDFLIRVNRQPCTAGQILQENDRVSITPTKIEGAACEGVACQGVACQGAACQGAA